MNKYMQEAQEIRKAIDVFAKNQTDETLIDNKAAFEWWRPGIAAEKDKIRSSLIYRTRTRIPNRTQPRRRGDLYRPFVPYHN